jgi:hypothetical protein
VCCLLRRSSEQETDFPDQQIHLTSPDHHEDLPPLQALKDVEMIEENCEVNKLLNLFD